MDAAYATHRCIGALHAIHARNVCRVDAQSCFVALRRQHEIPFYVTSIEPGPHAMWGECTGAPIHADIDFAPWMRKDGGLDARVVLVSLWVQICGEWHCHWERILNLLDTMPVGADMAALSSCPPNQPSVYVCLRRNDTQYEYFAVEHKNTDSPVPLKTHTLTTHAPARSCTWSDLEHLVHDYSEISRLCEANDLLEMRCAPALIDMSTLARKVRP